MIKEIYCSLTVALSSPVHGYLWEEVGGVCTYDTTQVRSVMDHEWIQVDCRKSLSWIEQHPKWAVELVFWDKVGEGSCE